MRFLTPNAARINSKFNIRFSATQRFLAGVILTIIFILSCSIFLPSASAQEKVDEGFKKNTAAVTLDGRKIFRVSRHEELTALDRANEINENLQTAVSSPREIEVIEVEIKQVNELPTIWINDQYLLTVTESDTQVGSTQDQANFWKSKLEKAIKTAQKEREPQYIKNAIIEAIVILILTLFCHELLGKIWQVYLHKIIRKVLPKKKAGEEEKSHRSSLDLFLSLTLASARVGIWTATLLYIADQFPFARRLSSQITRTLVSTFTTGIITLDGKSYSIPDLLILCSLLWGLILASKMVADLLRSRILLVTGISRGAQEVVAVIVRYGLVGLGAIVLLQVWGLNLSSLTILASALGVGIGFGFQDIAKNFGSGIVLLFERPIQVGDFVEVGEYQGTVERVGARSTVIKTLDMVSIIVPNSRFLETEVINWDHENSVSGVRLPVGVAYGSDVEAVRKSLLDVAKANPDTLAIPSPQVLFTGFGDSSLDFELRVWIAQPSRNIIIKSNLYYQIEAIFRQRDVEIPFPQRDLHVRGSLPLELSPELQDMLRQLSQNSLNGNNKKFNSSKLDT